MPEPAVPEPAVPEPAAPAPAATEPVDGAGPRDPSARAPQGRKPWLWLGGVLVLAAIGAGVWLSGILQPAPARSAAAGKTAASAPMILEPGTRLKEQASHPVAPAVPLPATSAPAARPAQPAARPASAPAAHAPAVTEAPAHQARPQDAPPAAAPPARPHVRKPSSASGKPGSQHEEILRKKEQLKQEMGL